MNVYLKKIFAALLFSVTLIAPLSGCMGSANRNPLSAVPAVSGEFSITALNIGKADALILKTENHTILIDSGEKGDGTDILSTLAEEASESVDYLIITHFDKDHVGGATKLLKNASIGQIITPNYEGTSSEYENFSATCEALSITPLRITENFSFLLDDVMFEVYPPKRQKYAESDNDYSLAVRATHGKNTFLFAGDAEETRLSEFKYQFSLPHTFLKVPHHGRFNGYTAEFINRVSPKYALITCSDKKTADEDTLSVLDSVGCQTYLTQNGTVRFVSDGESIQSIQ